MAYGDVGRLVGWRGDVTQYGSLERAVWRYVCALDCLIARRYGPNGPYYGFQSPELDLQARVMCSIYSVGS